MEVLGIEVTKEEFDYLFQQQERGKTLMVVDGKVIAIDYIQSEEEKIQEDIYKLTIKLVETDYIANKLAEAETEEEKQELRLQYATQLANRKMWRKEISDLQDKIKTLEQEV